MQISPRCLNFPLIRLSAILQHLQKTPEYVEN